MLKEQVGGGITAAEERMEKHLEEKLDSIEKRATVIEQGIEEAAEASDTLKTALCRTEERLSALEDLLKPQQTAQERFTGHYELWRMKRITAIVDHYGESWFRGKSVLELGSGYGDIGFVFSTLGAEVTYAEGRQDNYDVLRRRFPNSRIYHMNCENEWPFPQGEHFDLIIHMGLLYHLNDFQFSLEKCLSHTDELILETEVCDSADPYMVLKTEEEGWDQALDGTGSRPSGAFIERFLSEHGWSYERVMDSRCNALFHVYDWEIENTNTWKNGLRRFWFCKKEGGQVS